MNIKRYVLSILLILACICGFAQGNQWQTLHKVKKGETIFGIARDYKISIDELLDANPEMRTPGYELKKGLTIYIPKAKQKDVQKTQTQEIPVQKQGIDVGIMLPLHDIDGDGRRMVEFYRGILMAIEKLKNDGISINVKAWNVAQDTDASTTLANEGTNKLDIIFGPLYTKQVKTIGDFCRKNNIKMVIPFSINGNEVDHNPNIYQIYQTQQQITDASIEHFLEMFSDTHPVIIDCNDTTSRKGIFTFGLRKKLEEKHIDYSITNLRLPDEKFAQAFALNKRNIVILNTGRSPELTQVMKKLDVLTTNNQGVKISMFGYTDWLMYQKYNQNQEYFCKYDTYIPSTFYYNEASGTTQRFAKHYKELFNTDMMNALPHFAVTGYDQAMYFIGGLYKYGADFNAGRSQLYSTPLQTTFHFYAVEGGGFRNKAIQFIHFKPNGTIDSINY